MMLPLCNRCKAVPKLRGCSNCHRVGTKCRRRGWVRASQVTARNTDSLLTRVPRLRRWPGGREAVPVRRGPGSTDATVATIAADNTAWRALLARDAAYAGWWRIRYRDQVVGWVHKDYVQTHGSLGSLAVTWNRPQLSLLATTTDGLNVRSGPGTSHNIVASIAGGSTTRYDILGKDAATATWYQIRFNDEVAGWVSAAHIQTHGDLTALTVTWNRTATVPRLSLLATTTDGLNVRSGPGTIHDRIASIAGGATTRYDILGKDAATATWYQILFSDELTGWVEANDAVETEGNLNKVPPPEAGLADSVQTCVVRATPAATGTREGDITDRDNRYVVLGKNAATAAWYRIRFSDAVDGWVHKDHVQLYGESRNLPVVGTAPSAGSHPQLSLSATTTDGLNMRTGPGTGYRIVVTLPFATTRYDILGKDAATAAWYQIQFSDSVTGWVSATHVQTHGTLAGLTVTWNPTPQLSLLATTTDGLNVRSGPGTGHNIVASIAGGSTTRYNILGKDAATATWYQIRFSDELTGWVHGDYIQTHGDLSGLTVTWNPTPQLSLLATTTAGLNVRSGPSTDHGIVDTIAGGSTTRYNILGKNAATATWYQIRFSPTVTGWVYANLVQTHGNISGLTITWTPPQLSLLATTTANLNVRSGPSTDHGIVDTITGGSTTRYNILGKNAATATWYQIRFSNSVTGWVYANLVQTHGNISGLTITWTPPQLSLLATTTANLNVRSGPSTDHGIVGSITGGSTTRYTILGKNAAMATWYQIRFSNSVTGWVYANLIQTHGDLSGLTVTWTPPQLSLLATTTANLNVRSGPSTDHGIVGSITGGSTTRYTILGKNAATATWWQIRFSNSVTGWVYANLIQTHGNLSGLTVTWTPPQLSLLATTTANLNVRSGPSTDHGIVGSITGGSTTRYTILGKNAATATWWQIRFSNSVTGWVYANLVQTHGDLSGLTVTWIPPQLSLLATTTANLNVRSGPGTSHSIVGSIPGGSTTRYTILGKNAATATWWQIQFSNTVIGWVYANLIQTHGDVSGVPVR